MSLQRNDIINKVFSRSYLGYNDEEVDAFLDEIMNDIDSYIQQITVQKQENEKLKKQVDSLNEEVTKAAVGRQEILHLKEENRKLSDEIKNLKSMFEQEKVDRQKAQEEVRAMIDMAQSQARDIVTKAQERANSLIMGAELEGRKVAQSIQERERRIIDRAQQRAKDILSAAINVVDMSMGEKNDIKNSFAPTRTQAKEQNDQNAQMPERWKHNASNNEQQQEEKPWVNWLDSAD